jgi:hypothetical protein
MHRPVVRHCLLICLIVLLAVVVGLPARADYTKLYIVPNVTGQDAVSAQAILHGLEIVKGRYTQPTDWAPEVRSSLIYSGVFCTKLVFGTAGTPVADGSAATIGWTTSDNSCLLRDLSWYLHDESVQSVVPYALGGGPGGGELIRIGPGQYEWRICNDTGLPIMLDDVQLAVFGRSLTPEELEELAAEGPEGMIADRIVQIDLDLIALTTDILDADYHGPSPRSLTVKLDNAARDKEAGLALFERGRVVLGRVLWHRAIQHMNTFISEICSPGRGRGKLPADVIQDWASQAQNIIAEFKDLLGLEVHLVEDLSGTGVAPPVLLPDQCFSIPLTDIGPGDAVVLSGDLPLVGEVPGNGFSQLAATPDDGETPVLHWVEQAGVGGDMTPDDEPPVIDSAAIAPPFLYPGETLTEMALDVQVSDNKPGAFWYIDSVTPPEGGDYLIGDDLQTLWLLGFYPGDLVGMIDQGEALPPWMGDQPQLPFEYTITIYAMDAAGNRSVEPWVLTVPVEWYPEG